MGWSGVGWDWFRVGGAWRGRRGGGMAWWRGALVEGWKGGGVEGCRGGAVDGAMVADWGPMWVCVCVCARYSQCPREAIEEHGVDPFSDASKGASKCRRSAPRWALRSERARHVACAGEWLLRPALVPEVFRGVLPFAGIARWRLHLICATLMVAVGLQVGIASQAIARACAHASPRTCEGVSVWVLTLAWLRVDPKFKT